jgi:hypothetical protein
LPFEDAALDGRNAMKAACIRLGCSGLPRPPSDRPLFHIDGARDASAYRLPVHEDGAGATEATPEFRAVQCEVVPQDVEKRVVDSNYMV